MIEISGWKRLPVQSFVDVSILWDIKYGFDPEQIQSGGLHSFPLDSWLALYSLCLNSLLPQRETEPLPETSSHRMTYLQTLQVLRLF
jgi:hypothetical protein